RHPNSRPPELLPPTPAACLDHTAGQVSADPPSAGSPSASPAAPSAPARSDRNSMATSPLAVVGPEPSIPPARPPPATARRGSAPPPESAAGVRNSAGGEPHSSP